MNSAPHATSNGWDCSRTQARISNSYHSSLTPIPTTKSKGRPTFKSNTKDLDSGMSGYSGTGNEGGGNPLSMTYYYSNHKWGKDLAIKWNDLTTRPDPIEKSTLYEGEYSLFLWIVSISYSNIVKEK